MDIIMEEKILELFIENPEKSYHVRELAVKFKISPTTVSKMLKNYEKINLLTSQKKYNHLFFKANSENSLFKIEKLNFNIKKLNNSGLLDELEEFYLPKAIILFGSFAKAENTIKSDIDLLIISSSKKIINLLPYEKKLGHSIELHIYSSEEIEIMKRKNKELLNNFVNGIVLKGYWELF